MARVTPQEALQRVSSAQQQGMRLAKSKVVAEYIRDIDNNVYLYRNGSNGLILPADDIVTPILGIAEKADFSLELPTHVGLWLQGYADEIGDTLVVGGEPSDEPMADEIPRKDIAYMVKTTWAQKSPYNDKLIFEGKRCYAGCVAVAIAQVMYYWGKKGYRRGCMATAKYQYSGGLVIPATEALTKFDYAHLCTGTPKTAEEKEAVATLIERVGKAIKSKYATDGTSANVNYYPELAKKYLRIGTNIRLLKATNVGVAELEKAVYNEIANGCPVVMSAAGDSNGAHAFICDGYRKSDNKFHFNFGWGGQYDGYYAFSAMNLGTNWHYNNSKTATIGIKPDYRLGDANRNGKINVTDAMTVVDHSLNGPYDEASDINSDGKVTTEDVQPIVDHILGKERL